MIFDHLINADIYGSLHTRFTAAFEYLRNTPCHDLPPGKQTIQGDSLFALVNRYETQPLASCRYESHRRYIDIQYMVRGSEQIGVLLLPTAVLASSEAYQAERDVEFYAIAQDAAASSNLLTLTPGTFAIFFPHDAHQPGIAVAAPQAICKVVVKVAID